MVGRGGAEHRGRMMIASRGMRAFVRAHIILFMRSFLHPQPIPKFIEPFYKPLALSVVTAPPAPVYVGGREHKLNSPGRPNFFAAKAGKTN